VYTPASRTAGGLVAAQFLSGRREPFVQRPKVLLRERLVELLTLLRERLACVLMTCPNCALGHRAQDPRKATHGSRRPRTCGHERRRPGASPEGISVNNAVPAAPAAPPASSPPPRRRPGAGALLTLVNGVLAGVASVYVGTRSILVTLIAAAVAIVLAVLVLAFQR
jgi:hypothetical protein